MESAEQVLARWAAEAGARARTYAAGAAVAASRVKVLVAVRYAGLRADAAHRLRAVRRPR
ncbi:hypothetical protein [Amycolatopsis sp. SID8362]|uniref:hypothetical protein n=1 Tax=Amycolatopsis sp. SID8362 TaxID=2690346 RepID=UPI00136AA57F|nr:hypothetical protein [Amycolatopsis sp. SID8362]NBH10479.1 hypothetical protein [Amycolatopsis sp. SID8362]NED47173.1 hypothetical protein [Amycolatopsis sp. SID8362]